MNSIIKRLSGICIILLGVICLAIHHFTGSQTNTLLVVGGAALIIGVIWYIVVSSRTRG